MQRTLKSKKRGSAGFVIWSQVSLAALAFTWGCTHSGTDTNSQPATTGTSGTSTSLPGAASDTDTLSGTGDMAGNGGDQATGTTATGTSAVIPPASSTDTMDTPHSDSMGTMRTGSTGSASTGTSGTTGGTAPGSDNSRTNTGERELTSMDQGNSTQDVEMTQKIRRALTSDKDLSTYAHNVKVITREGAVYLKGPVRSAEEKRKVEDAARKVAGAMVTSELTVTPQ